MESQFLSPESQSPGVWTPDSRATSSIGASWELVGGLWIHDGTFPQTAEREKAMRRLNEIMVFILILVVVVVAVLALASAR